MRKKYDFKIKGAKVFAACNEVIRLSRPYPFGTSTTDISITTANGYTDQANVSSSDVIAWTFNIPQNQGNWVRVCINSENSSRENCNTYNTTGADMSVSPSPVLDNNNGKSMYRGNHGIGGFSGSSR